MGTEKLNELIRMNGSLRVSLGQACWLGCTKKVCAGSKMYVEEGRRMLLTIW